MAQYYPLCYSITATETAPPIIVRLGRRDGHPIMSRVWSVVRDDHLVYTPNLILEDLEYDPAQGLWSLDGIATFANTSGTQMRAPLDYLDDPESYDDELQEGDWDEFTPPEYDDDLMNRAPSYEDIPPPSYDQAILTPPAY